ncbi:MAG: DUF2147 domain-containing protein, partial [Pseudomonadota bacterium]
MDRSKVWRFLWCLGAAGLVAGPAYGQTSLVPIAQQAQGVWADENGDSNIRIEPCSSGLCGRVIWLKNPNDDTGRPKTDSKNPDETLRTRPLLGLTIIAGLKLDQNAASLKGRVYNADDGKIYDLYLSPKGKTMKVKGCIFSVLCDTQIWT